MIQSILNIVPWIKALYTDYTTARAAKLDNLDAAISTRAPASTALSTATWTATRAGKIDNLDVAVSSRLSSAIKSVQYVTLSSIAYSSGNISGTKTISSVNTSKTILIPMLRGNTDTSGTTLGYWLPTLASSTSVSVSGSVVAGGSGFVNLGTVIVVEFN